MPAFQAEKEYLYNKSKAETLNDIEEALKRIGKVTRIDVENGVISGKTRFGLQGVKIKAVLVPEDGQTKITFHGKSDDVQGIGAQKGIERVFETMQNLDNPEFTPSKTGITFGQIAANVLAVVLAFLIGYFIENQWIGILVLAVSVVFINLLFSKSKK